MNPGLGPPSFFILKVYDLGQDTSFPCVLVSLTRKSELNRVPSKIFSLLLFSSKPM